MDPEYFNSQGARLAFRRSAGKGPTVIWCGGLKSDMDGSKAVFLHERCNAAGRAFVRFDYFGHGISEGDFQAGTLSRWSADVVAVIDRFAGEDGAVLVGSSMGGWASLLAALARPDVVHALCLINPAPDFTERVWESWDDHKRDMLIADGVVYEPSDYDEPYAYSRALIEDGRARSLLGGPIAIHCPVEILQGAADTVVLPEHSRPLIDALQSEAVGYTLVKGGDHSLSRPDDLSRLWRAVDGLVSR